MGLFKSKEERRIERELRIKSGLRAIERAMRQQEKLTEEFIRAAQSARRAGDQQQYAFIRGNLKRAAGLKQLLQRQLLAMKSAMLVQQQARSSQQFAEAMRTLARDIASAFGETSLANTQSDWERAVAQAATLEERMDLFLQSMERPDSQATVESPLKSVVSDEEIDRLIDTELLAGEYVELARLEELESELDRELRSQEQG